MTQSVSSTAASPVIKVAVVEDSTKIRESLAILLDSGTDFKCVGAYASAELALRHIPAIKPDVVLMDIHLPQMSGIECVAKLKAQMPTLKIVMHTVYSDGEQLFQSLRAGADGYLLKRTAPDRLLESLAEVFQGRSPMSGEMARMVVEFFHHKLPVASGTGLTERENQILAHLAKGYRYKEIGDLLEISLGTVRTHVRNIYEKLHVTSRTEAVVKYLGNKQEG